METNIGSAVLKMLGSLIFILALIFGFFYFLKKIKGGSLAFAKNPLRLVGLLNLGPRRSVALVEIRDIWLVLGIAPDAITLLEKMGKPAQKQEEEKKTGAGFRALLAQALFRKPHSPDKPESCETQEKGE